MTDDVTEYVTDDDVKNENELLYNEAKKLMRSLPLLQTMQRDLQTIQRALHPTQEDIEIAKAIREYKQASMMMELAEAIRAIQAGKHGLAPPLHPVDAPLMRPTMHPVAPPVHPQFITRQPAPSENAPLLPQRESPRHARLPDGTYRCSLCGHIAETRNSIKSHYRRKHREW